LIQCHFPSEAKNVARSESEESDAEIMGLLCDFPYQVKRLLQVAQIETQGLDGVRGNGHGGVEAAHLDVVGDGCLALLKAITVRVFLSWLTAAVAWKSSGPRPGAAVSTWTMLSPG